MLPIAALTALGGLGLQVQPAAEPAAWISSPAGETHAAFPVENTRDVDSAALGVVSSEKERRVRQATMWWGSKTACPHARKHTVCGSVCVKHPENAISGDQKWTSGCRGWEQELVLGCLQAGAGPFLV